MDLMDERYSLFLKWYHTQYLESMDRCLESISYNQIICKKWLVENLDNVQIPRDENGQFNIEIVGGWFGFPLIHLLMDKYPEIKRIHLYELDKQALRACWKYTEIFGYDHVKTFHMDYFDDVNQRRAHLIINTSCEHMPDMIKARDNYVTPERTLLALQSNDMIGEPDHVNCVNSTNELAEKAGIKELWGGYKKMNEDAIWAGHRYNRYMVMGKWI